MVPTYPWEMNSNFLPGCEIIQTSQSHPSTGTKGHPNLLSLPSLPSKACFFTLLPRATSVWPCRACGTFLPWTVSICGWITATDHICPLSGVKYLPIPQNQGKESLPHQQGEEGVVEEFIFTSWSIFVITALKSFSDNSNICHLGWHLLIFFSHASWDFRVLHKLYNVAWTFLF